mmetsp:Transcript_4009/g.5903  ORF Transcript_4009/g.5903 Transcript_4009/m.5903 type:complete len:215 (+) Transcript_4009:429-1073(+)
MVPPKTQQLPRTTHQGYRRRCHARCHNAISICRDVGQCLLCPHRRHESPLHQLPSRRRTQILVRHRTRTRQTIREPRRIPLCPRPPRLSPVPPTQTTPHQPRNPQKTRSTLHNTDTETGRRHHHMPRRIPFRSQPRIQCCRGYQFCYTGMDRKGEGGQNMYVPSAVRKNRYATFWFSTAKVQRRYRKRRHTGIPKIVVQAMDSPGGIQESCRRK